MGPRKSNDTLNEVGYPGLLYKLCKEEDVLIIPQFVTHLTSQQLEYVSPRMKAAGADSSTQPRQKESKGSEKFGSDRVASDRFGSEKTSHSMVESKAGDDLLMCGNIPPPQVGITYEHPEDKETPVAVICKNFYIEFALISAIGKSLKPYPTISILKIENCCISREIAEALALLLAEDSGKWISDLSLDGNEGIADVLPLFVKLATGLRYLSFERCSLEDTDVEMLAEALAYGDGKDQKLLYLNLSMNKIGNAGVAYLAEALRTNRSLFSLSLAGNQIDDEGVACLTEVLQKFPLAYEELVLRRRRIFDMIFRKKSAVEKRLEELKVKVEVETPTPKPSEKVVERMGRKIRGPDGKIRCTSGRETRNRLDTPKTNSGEKFPGKVKSVVAEEGGESSEPSPSEVLEIVQQVDSEFPPDKHPFVNEVRLADNLLWCQGCWSLGSINLAFNYLTEKSLGGFLEVLRFQTENYLPKTGIWRLVLLPGNRFGENAPEYQQLQTAVNNRMARKDVSDSPDRPLGSISSARVVSSGRIGKK